jgi:hypothetical protein
MVKLNEVNRMSASDQRALALRFFFGYALRPLPLAFSSPRSSLRRLAFVAIEPGAIFARGLQLQPPCSKQAAHK